MSHTKQVVVIKQDGTVERFSPSKLTNCLATVLRELTYDPRLAAPLARAIAMHLQQWPESDPPTTAYIYRCVRSVLRQTGLSDVADELATHRRRRRTLRQRIRVLEPGQPDDAGEAWRKSALIEKLQNKYGLRHAVCRFMAGQIEAQVFALDYRRVSKAFLRELVRNEVLAWGLADEHPLRARATASEPPVVAPQPEKES